MKLYLSLAGYPPALKHLPLQKAFKMVYNDRRYKIKNAMALYICSLEYPYMFVIMCFNDLFSLILVDAFLVTQHM